MNAVQVPVILATHTDADYIRTSSTNVNVVFLDSKQKEVCMKFAARQLQKHGQEPEP